MDVVDPKDPIQIPFCGPKNMKPLTAYTPFRDINVGDFVLVKLHDPDFVLYWMGKIEGDVIKDEKSEHFKMVKVQWWVFVKKGSNLDEQHLYEDCWNGKWKCNLVDLEKWLDISSIFFFFPTQKNTTNKSQISIPTTYASRAKVNFDVVNVSTNL
jgi:hypothetical protein